MATSSRESSPMASASPTQLTPRSKVNAMLAGLDSSDDESVSGDARQRLVSKMNKSTTSKPQPTENTIKGTLGDVAKQMSEEDEDEEEEIIRPKGRLASRMQAATESTDEEPVANNPRDRVKRLLKKQVKEPSAATDEDRNSEDSATPIASRRRKVRKSPRGTPNKPIPRQDSASPGLFVTPNAPRSATPPADGSDSDELPSNPLSNARFQALVEKKRQERLQKEKEAQRVRAEKAAERERQAAIIEEDDIDDDSEDEGGRRLTQQTRPTRKASKKALEEMHRETQRMSRNMQLAHQAKTKKKITKQSLFARFNYKQNAPEAVSSDPVRPPSSSPGTHADVEMKDTPPTSPFPGVDGAENQKSLDPAQSTNFVDSLEDEEELPTLEDVLTRLPSLPPSRMDKGKGKAIDTEPAIVDVPAKKPLFKQRPIRVQPANGFTKDLNDSDSDLEIVTTKKTARDAKLDAIFNRVPAKQAKEPKSMIALRMLAHLTSPGKQQYGKNQKPSMTAKDLQVSLQQKARQQAHREREERIQALRDRGVIVQTAEEREQEMAEVDDLLARARREGEEITAREKAAAKKVRKANGEVDPLDESSDDEDWEEGQDAQDDNLDFEDDEHEDSENEDSDEPEDEDDENKVPNPVFDDEAVEDEAEDSETDLSIKEAPLEPIEVDDEDEILPATSKPRRSRATKVISDDEEEDEERADFTKQTPKPTRTMSPAQPRTDSPAFPTSVLRSAKRTFIPGLTVAGPAGLGLTQIFAGTMDDSQEFEASEAGSQQVDAMSFLRRRNTGPELPPFVPTMSEEESQDIVMDSQTQIPESQPQDVVSQAVQISFSQSQIHGFDSLLENPSSTQMSDFPLTQDGGFQMITPIKSRFVEPPSPIGTIRMNSQQDRAVIETLQETPIVKKKGKLHRRAQVASFSDEEDEVLDTIREDMDDAEDFEISANAFDVMRKASKKKVKVVDDFDKKKSNAKEMVNEQAEESEDEYAGLGGASDDESGGEEDAFFKEMIDDEKKDVDESELARFYADRERANDEKQIEKLYKDISNGMLRRKRGADYDLSDSDDGGEARIRRKRAEFAKMRKALLADERIGKIAENPKREAFLRAIEDRGSDDEIGFLDDFPEKDEESSESQSQTQNDEPQGTPDNQPTEVMGPPKRKRSEDTAYVRPPPNLRRINVAKKPSNLQEIRQSVSSLIEEPNPIFASTGAGSDSDDDLEIEGGPEEKNKENRDPFLARRPDMSIIDRISLKRANSSNLSNNERLAFAAPSSAPGFKVPPLLRKATTNSSIVSTSSVSGGTSTTERMAGGKEGEGIRKGASKNSGVNYFARESERRAAIEKTEKRREQKKFKGAENRRKVVGGLFGKGKFE